jgi:hypothetical protein
MANTLTNLIPDVFAALDVVSRELVGFIPAVTIDAQASRVASGQTVRVPITPAATAETITPGTTPPDTGDQTFSNATITIDNFRAVPFRYSGEEEAGLASGPGAQRLRVNQIAQAFRTLVAEVEADLAGLYTKASRAYGTSGTAPFGTVNVLTDFAKVRQILDDNGAPQSDLQLVLGSAAMANLRGIQASLFKVNEAGTEEFLRQGFISQGVHGFAVRNSSQIASHTKGTAASTWDSDLIAGYAAGATSIHLDTGTGTHKAGDLITFAGDTNVYVVGADSLNTSGDKDITLNGPGLRQTLANDVSLAAPLNNYTANLAFHRSAIVLAARLPYVPEGGDMADDRISITDPMTGFPSVATHSTHPARLPPCGTSS